MAELRYPNDIKKQLWWCRGVEYKFKRINTDKGIAIVEHTKVGSNKTCEFKTRTGYMLNSSYQCPKCDPTAQENVLDEVESILMQLSEQRKGSYIKSKNYKDNKIFIFKYKGKNALFIYLDRRYFNNVLYTNTYHDLFTKPILRKYDNVFLLTHLQYPNLKSEIIKSLRTLGGK